MTSPARFLQSRADVLRRGTTQRRLRAASDATVALGSRPAPNTVQPARPHQTRQRAGLRRQKTCICIYCIYVNPFEICDRLGVYSNPRCGTSPDRGSQPEVIRSRCHHHPPTTKGLRRPFERARHAHAPPTARRPARRRRETLERRRRRSRAALLPCATVLPLRSSVVEAVAARFERMNTNCNSSLFRVSLFKISQSLSVSLGIRVRLRALHSIPLATFRTQFISLYIQSVQLSSPYCRGLESPKTRVRCPRPPRSI